MRKRMVERHVALLRGVNLGGTNKLPMKDLAEMLTAAGCGAVRTYIQSGNVVFEAGARLAAQVPGLMLAEIEKRFGFRTTVVTRTAAELRAAAEGNPFLAEGAAEETLSLMFLESAPTAEQVASLDPQRSPGDRFAVRGRDVYFHVTTSLATTKLTNAYFDSRLKTVSTARNWRTVKTLLAMAEEA